MTSHPDVLIAGGTRTPFGKFGGALRDAPSVQLAGIAMRAALDRAGIPATDVNDVYSGISIPAEEALDGCIPARVAMLAAGIPESVLSMTIDRACCSGMTAIQLGMRTIRDGRGDVVVAGGADNMMRSAMLLPPSVRWGLRRGGPTLKDPLADAGADIGGRPVAVDAGEVAIEHGVTRAASDEFALRSHERYFAAKKDGFFTDEISPLGPEYGELAEDEGPRPDTSIEALTRLKTVFGGPLVTAGNAPGQDAGASYVVLASSDYAERAGLTPIARVAESVSIARNPREIAVAPAEAIAKLLSVTGWRLDDVGVIEINEAFACVPLASVKVLADGDVGRERALLASLNPNGGAVALGHPPAASGGRLALTLARELARSGRRRGVAAICGGLGQAEALAIELLD